MFNFQPNLEGTLIAMRAMVENDFEALFAIAADPLIWEVHPARTRWQRENFQTFVDDAFADKGGLAAIEKATGQIAGFSRYSAKYVRGDEIEIGWTFLSRHLWGGTHNQDMKRIMLDHALKAFPRAIFRIGEDNVRSRRAVEKIGGMLLDSEEVIQVLGRDVRYVSYEITRDGFAQGLGKATAM